MMRETSPFVDTDFQSLNTFSLQWRWTDARHTILPPEILADIHPFTAQSARDIAAWSDHFLDLSQTFASVRQLNSSLVDDDDVRDWLGSQGVHGNSIILASWQPDCAVLTQWSIFCQHWNTFCYPVSDDLIVWPLSEEWALQYRHDEKIFFGTRCTKENANYD